MKPGTAQPLLGASALGAALCVLLLAILAASPELHAGLHAAAGLPAAGCADHGEDAPVGDPGHVCAITLLAQGATLLLGVAVLGRTHPVGMYAVFRATDTVPAAQPRYRLAPSHAPPAA